VELENHSQSLISVFTFMQSNQSTA